MKYYTDGYTTGGNPSNGGGFTVVDESGHLLTTEVINKEGFTNNEAELLGIEWAVENAQHGDTISTDSMCMLSWIHSGKSKARRDLQPIMRRIGLLVMDRNLNLCWEGRDFNLAGIYNEKMKLDTGRPAEWVKKSKHYLKHRGNKMKRNYKNLLPSSASLEESEQQVSFLRSI